MVWLSPSRLETMAEDVETVGQLKLVLVPAVRHGINFARPAFFVYYSYLRGENFCISLLSRLLAGKSCRSRLANMLKKLWNIGDRDSQRRNAQGPCRREFLRSGNFSMFSVYPICEIAPKHTDEPDEGFINILFCMFNIQTVRHIIVRKYLLEVCRLRQFISSLIAVVWQLFFTRKKTPNAVLKMAKT